eukprot:scaffold1449_cov324-Prasinococcus_capsulatus_cf.AAC.3
MTPRISSIHIPQERARQPIRPSLAGLGFSSPGRGARALPLQLCSGGYGSRRVRLVRDHRRLLVPRR